MMRNRILLICLVALLSSCVSQQGAMKYYLKHNDQLAELCSAKFPVINRLAEGIPSYQTDTVFIPGVSIPCPEVQNPTTGEKTTTMVRCPDTEKIYVNKTVRDTIYSEDTAKIFALQSKYENQLADLQNKRNVELTKKSELQGDYNSIIKERDAIKKKLTESRWALLVLVVLIASGAFILFKK